jgi:hypothetical protein
MTMPIRSSVLLSFVMVSSTVLAHAMPPAFARMSVLVGDWEARTTSGTIKVSYRAIANDSALLQTFRTASGIQTATVFHPDGDRLLATHYCGQGNQPRLRLDPASTDARWIFTFLDATNLARPSASHLVRLELVAEDADHYTEIETYEQDGASEVTRLRFRRAR